MIRLEHIYKYYGKNRILKDLSFCFKNKGLYLLKGENGCGKTTLLNIMSGKDLSYEGKVEIGEDIFYLPFDNYLIKELSVKENIELSKDIFNDFKKINYELKIDELMHKTVSRLSLGERQRLGIFIALSSGCKIILLDEPLDGLDEIYRNKIIKILKKEAHKKLIIIVSHMEIAGKNIERIYLVNNQLKGNSVNNKIKRKDIEKKELKHSYKWGFKLNLKQKILRIMFIASISSILLCQISVNEELNKLNEDFQTIFIKDKNLYYKKNTSSLNLENFYDQIIYTLASEVSSYNIGMYAYKMYESIVMVNDNYIADGFLFSNIYNLDGLKDDEIVLEINKLDYCKNNLSYTCLETSIKNLLKERYIEYRYKESILKYKIKDVVFGESNTIYTSNINKIIKDLVKLYSDDEISFDYSVSIYNDKLSKFYNKIYSIKHLLGYDFYLYYSDEEYSLFLVREKEREYFSNKELSNEIIACSDMGYSCNSLNFGILSSLIYIDSSYVKDKIIYKKDSKDLEYNEIVISSYLAKYLNKEKGELIDISFYIDEEFYKLDNIKIIDVIEDNDLAIYHSDYDYNLYKEKFNKYLKVEYVYSDFELEEYEKSNLLDYQIIEDASVYLSKLIKFINYSIYILWGIIIFILLVIEKRRGKKHLEFYSNLYLNKVNEIDIKKVMLGYISLYLILGLLLLKDIYLYIIYNVIVIILFSFEFRKIKSRKFLD